MTPDEILNTYPVVAEGNDGRPYLSPEVVRAAGQILREAMAIPNQPMTIIEGPPLPKGTRITVETAPEPMPRTCSEVDETVQVSDVPPMPQPLDPGGPRPPGGYTKILQDWGRGLARRLCESLQEIEMLRGGDRWWDQPTLFEARAQGAREERERLAPFLKHWGFCPGFEEPDGNLAMANCTCGLRKALEPKP